MSNQNFQFPRCKTCTHWTPVLEKHVRFTLSREVELAGGFCGSGKLSEEYGHGPTSLVYSYTEGGEFWTGAEFGCVNHEPRIHPAT